MYIYIKQYRSDLVLSHNNYAVDVWRIEKMESEIYTNCLSPCVLSLFLPLNPLAVGSGKVLGVR